MIFIHTCLDVFPRVFHVFSWISWTANMDLSRIGKREALKAKVGDEPHWQRLRAGCYLGFRPSKKGGKGSWLARAYDPEAGKYARKALGNTEAGPGTMSSLKRRKMLRLGASRSKAEALSQKRSERFRMHVALI